MNNQNNIIARLEAMLFASGDPIDVTRLAEVLEIDVESTTKALSHLSAFYDEHNSGIKLVRMDGKYQLCTREEYEQDVRKLLEIKKNAPLSNAAFEVLAIVAYNKNVTRSFIEQVRGVDCSGSISGLVEKGLIEEKGRLDLPGRPLVYGTTDRFLRCFSLTSLDDLPELPKNNEDLEKIVNDNQTSLFDNQNEDTSQENIADEEKDDN